MNNQKSYLDDFLPRTREDLTLIRGIDMGAGVLCLLAALQIFGEDKAVAKPLAVTFLLGGAFAFGVAAAIVETIIFRCEKFPNLLDGEIYRRPHRMIQRLALFLAIVGAFLMYVQLFSGPDAELLLRPFRGVSLIWCFVILAFLIFLPARILSSFQGRVARKLAGAARISSRRVLKRGQRSRHCQGCSQLR